MRRQTPVTIFPQPPNENAMIETLKTWKLIAALGLGMAGGAVNATVVLVGN